MAHFSATVVKKRRGDSTVYRPVAGPGRRCCLWAANSPRNARGPQARLHQHTSVPAAPLSRPFPRTFRHTRRRRRNGRKPDAPGPGLGHRPCAGPGSNENTVRRKGRRPYPPPLSDRRPPPGRKRSPVDRPPPHLQAAGSHPGHLYLQAHPGRRAGGLAGECSNAVP